MFASFPDKFRLLRVSLNQSRDNLESTSPRLGSPAVNRGSNIYPGWNGDYNSNVNSNFLNVSQSVMNLSKSTENMLGGGGGGSEIAKAFDHNGMALHRTGSRCSSSNKSFANNLNVTYKELKRALRKNKRLVRVRTIRIDNESLLKSYLLDCFVERHGFYESVCSVCAREKYKMNEFYKKTGLLTMKKSHSMPAVAYKTDKETPSSQKTRCFFTTAQLRLAQTFKAIDLDFDNKLSFKEFYAGISNIILKKHAIHSDAEAEDHEYKEKKIKKRVDVSINEATAKLLFTSFDRNKDGFVDFAEFVRGINIPMCQKRCNVLIEAFRTLDTNRDGLIDIVDLRHWFRFNGFNLRRTLYKEENANERAIRDWMSSFNDPESSEDLTPITVDKFLEYFHVISSTVMNDLYFDLLIRGCYRLEKR